MKTLVIVGHGKQKDGSFDPGATGFIKQGEHRYFRDVFVPAMKKYLPAKSEVSFYDKLKVSNHGSLKEVSAPYGKDVAVVELHFDAFDNPSASGGHIIVHDDFKADELDLKLRDVIKKHIGVRYEHKGDKGVSGRDDLWNVNDAKKYGINYRLVELGFGTNREDSDKMLRGVDAIAKDFVKALVGTVKDAPKVETINDPSVHKVVKGDTVWAIAKKAKVTTEELRRWNGLKSNLIQVGQVLTLERTPRFYTVKKGDSLSKIGKELDVNWQNLAKINKINSPYVIKVGQKLEY